MPTWSSCSSAAAFTATVRLARRNGLHHGGGSSSPGSPSSSSSSSSSSGGDAGGTGGPKVLGALGKPVNGAEILKNLEAFCRADIYPQIA